MKLCLSHSRGRTQCAVWMAISALSLGCESPSKTSEPQQSPAARSLGQEARVASQQPRESTKAAAQETAPKVKSAKADDAPDATPRVFQDKKESSGPVVKRLIIASSVEDREPVELVQGKVSEPVLAFVELAYAGATETNVVVTFEHESGKKVGFIELSVPAESPRYRTWGRTANIRQAGTWTAVIKTSSGEELARQSFEVAG